MKRIIKYRNSVAFVYVILNFFSYKSGSALFNDDADFLFWLPFILQFSFWVFVLQDMIRTEIYQKTFWIVSMFLLPYFAPLFYLFQRKKLEHIQSNLFNKRE